LRRKIRKKDGKRHRYWSIVENKRVAGGRVVQKHVLHLGEINSSQELAWRRSIEVMDEGGDRPKTLALFPEDRCEGILPDASIVRLKLSHLRLCRPRQWGACWLALSLWEGLQLDRFWSERLPASRKGTRWDQELFVLVAYRLLAPGSEWRLHREWFERTALAEMRQAHPPVQYSVGVPKGRLSRLERDLVGKSWQEARPGVEVKLLPRDGELYVFAQSLDRVAKERSMRRRQLKGLWARLNVHRMSVNLTRDDLLIKLGQARAKWPGGWRLLEVEIDPKRAAFQYALDRKQLRQARRREGCYLLRSNLTEGDTTALWSYYIQLVQVEEAFRTLKGDLAVRPIHHY